MSWAAHRRFIILFTLGAIVVAFLAILSIATFYEAPSCVDNTQNQGESGVDCGGPCAYLCRAEQFAPTILFTQAIGNGSGRTDVIAEIENKNDSAAARRVPYQITLYGTGQTLIQTVSGIVDLPPKSVVPVFVPGVTSGKQLVVNAFLEIAPEAPKWFSLTRDPRVVPTVSGIRQSGTVGNPRIEATLRNPSATALENIRVIVLVRDAKKDVVGASSTVIPIIPAQGEATALFTWNVAFSAAAASIEVAPIIPLP